MTNKTPKGFHTVTPFLMSADPDGLLEFMKKGLGAEVTSVLRAQNGKVWHAQIKIGDSMVLLGDAMDNPPQPQMLYLYVDDADAAYKKALAAGGESVMEPADQFYGDRNGGIKDASGNTWWFATHIEDVSDDEMQKRAREFEKKVKAA